MARLSDAKIEQLLDKKEAARTAHLTTLTMVHPTAGKATVSESQFAEFEAAGWKREADKSGKNKSAKDE